MRHIRLVLSFLTISAISPLCLGGDWQITPRLDLIETYSDNIRLAGKGQEQDDFATQVNPGVHIKGEGRRLLMDLDYGMQNIAYARNRRDNDTRHQLHGLLNTEVIKDYAFLDLQTEIGQRFAEFQQARPNDNLDIVGNRIDFQAYRISPAFKHRLFQVLDTELRYGYSYFSSKDERNPLRTKTRDSDMFFRTGNDRDTAQWNGFLQYVENKHRLENNNNPRTDRRRSLESILGYALDLDWRVRARAGYEDNDVNDFDRGKNGGYASLGALWRWNYNTKIHAFAGYRDKEIGVRRLSKDQNQVELIYRNREVGLLTGPNWIANLRYKYRRSVLQAAYRREVTNDQQLIFAGNQLTPIIDPDTGNTIIVGRDIFQLDDRTFLRKRGEIQLNRAYGMRSTFSFLGYREERDFNDANDRDEKVAGITANYHYVLNSHNSLNFDTYWDKHNFFKRGLKQDYYSVGANYSRRFSSHIEGLLRLQRIWRDSEPDDQQPDYVAHRISAEMKVLF